MLVKARAETVRDKETEHPKESSKVPKNAKGSHTGKTSENLLSGSSEEPNQETHETQLMCHTDNSSLDTPSFDDGSILWRVE